ncbi:GNAT family N-acetyltransferase [Pseudomonas alliivorans]|uniref:GNAT family N-acetyltransferase n=1 Tax=Pseudomonas TaxID=286 RepID=UPI000C0878BA|nr:MULTISPECIES: GNAT family N-acetyltransferase [Pseudomonas]MBP0943620.1 GNAT family N-acetyltransferase [Pseudomonas alliivorans]MEE4679173.1 GNAT family N-acetyltransferase [Pseudomonas alliivorans]MEE4689832.1 GNAT family N-acetyltransferase [Pseudomonas alliivorans]MEE4706060.1 GNAT family N-acetyltransferase [Pseudomonas alliivorans]MEE4709523.1 GNAT family N-acetyltransferase [Pseudomonas alliivorans]
MNTTRTDRLVLRDFEVADVPALAGILGDPHVMRYSVRGVLSEQATGEFVRNCMHAYSADGFGPQAVIEVETNRLIGFCGLNAEQVDQVMEVEIGYRLAPSYWGRGLASEAALVTLRHGFETLQLASVIAIVQPENIASVRVLHKAGFRDYIHSQYHRLGVRIYRLTLEQWQSRHC